MQIEKRIDTDRDAATVFAYLSDFESTTEWDPGTVRTVRIAGDGGVGTQYRNTSKFLGRETELIYTVTSLVPGRQIALRGENKTVVAHDTITVEPTATGSQVHYRAEFDFQGITKFLAPLAAPAFAKLGNEAEKGMTEAFAKL